MAWHCKTYGGYGIMSTEAEDNATEAWHVMSALGWALLPFCAMWGNVQHESEYNPWRWQGDHVLASDSPDIYVQNGHAYGLVQWDPASKYITGGAGYTGYGPNFSNQTGLITEGSAQLHFLDDTAVSSTQYVYPNEAHPMYSMPYDTFKQITYPEYSFDWATKAWFWNYERGTWNDIRTQACERWYLFLQNVPPTPVGNIPIWLLFKLKQRNEGNYD